MIGVVIEGHGRFSHAPTSSFDRLVMSETAIRVHGLGKKYHIGGQRNRYKTVRAALSDTFAQPVKRAAAALRGSPLVSVGGGREFWALKNISFEVNAGDVVGIIGRNGAGKSTLLKILSRITEPTEGFADVYGRMGSLLEVGMGFHPELTGRENVFLNGAILGMTRAEVARKFDEIVAFAEVENFIDTPVKHYSSGMGLRLGFAVAAHLEPEILVVDEVLAVGDAAFQKKCLGKMGDIAHNGRTVLLVSHNMAAISALCNKGVLLVEGQLAGVGPIAEIITQYIKSGEVLATTPLSERTDREGSGEIRFTGVRLLDEYGEETPAAVSGKQITLLLAYQTTPGNTVNYLNACIEFLGPLGELLFVCETRLGYGGRFTEVPEKGLLACHIPSFPLNAGSYKFNLHAKSTRILDRVDDAGRLLVESGDFYGTGQVPGPKHRDTVMVHHSWKILADP